jgi:magnesium chelatase subunit D
MTPPHAAHLPFPALVGLDHAQEALILLAIDPALRGVAIAAPAGTGKSSLARGLRAVLDDPNAPFVEVPASVDTENLMGGLDLETTLRTGRAVMQPGVLARAHGGIAYVDGLNLLADGAANLLLSVLDEGVLQIEREGISRRVPADFALITTYDPAEGNPRQHLLDRLALIVNVPGATTPDEREAVLRHNLLTDAADWDEDVAFMRGLVQAAREQLPDVTITPEQVAQIAGTAVAYGVQGQRVDLFAVRAACAAAAAQLRDEVLTEDIETAVRLVIFPRATRVPVPPPDQQQQQAPPPEANQPDADEPPPPDEQPPDDPSDNDEDDEGTTPSPDELLRPEEIFEALAAQLPQELDGLPFRNLRKGRAGSRGTTEGTRGRHIRSVPGDPKRAPLDVVGTLRAAAPWQRLRGKGRGGGNVKLKADDLRVKQYRTKAGALFCFAVDASGSMALHRMQQAKGAVNELLGQAYVNRDRIALVAFRGEQAELLMPPTQSVELARRNLDVLPTGGGTPLASALLLALDVAEGARSRGILQTVLVLLTDGRGNVAFHDDADPQAELEQLGAVIAESPLEVVVVDTKRSYLSRGEARQLAGWLGATYAYLPNADSGQIAAAAQDALNTS